MDLIRTSRFVCTQFQNIEQQNVYTYPTRASHQTNAIHSYTLYSPSEHSAHITAHTPKTFIALHSHSTHSAYIAIRTSPTLLILSTRYCTHFSNIPHTAPTLLTLSTHYYTHSSNTPHTSSKLPTHHTIDSPGSVYPKSTWTTGTSSERCRGRVFYCKFVDGASLLIYFMHNSQALF